MATEIPVTERILDDRTLVKGVIYCIEHKDSGKQYVGQTVTHRLNKGKYRPYGIRRRFAEHGSNAIRNTKPTQSSCLYNAIREHGPAAFTIHELEVCELGLMDDRERYWIDLQNSQYPEGYNLTTGGCRDYAMIATVPTPERNPAGKRGGCMFRSEETRMRMSNSVKAATAKPEVIAKRSTDAKLQHNAAKFARFADVMIDPLNLDQYIMVRKNLVLVKVGDQTARFTGKSETADTLVTRAKEFLLSLCTPSPTPDIITHVVDSVDE